MSLSATVVASKALAAVRKGGAASATITSTVRTYNPATRKTETVGDAEIVTVESTPLFPQDAGRRLRTGDTAAREVGVIYVPAQDALTFLPEAGNTVSMAVDGGAQSYTVTSVAVTRIGTTPVVFELGLARGVA
jgi:hypothetical protein